MQTGCVHGVRHSQSDRFLDCLVVSQLIVDLLSVLGLNITFDCLVFFLSFSFPLLKPQFSPSMITANSIKNIFKVEAPVIRENPAVPYRIVIRDSEAFRRHWTITLARTFDFLRVTLNATDDPYMDIGFTIWMHILSLANGSPMKFAIPPSEMQVEQLSVTGTVSMLRFFYLFCVE